MLVNTAARFLDLIIPVDHRFPSLLLSVVLAIGAISIASAADDSVDFVLDVKPFVESHCVGCHKEGHAKGELRLDTKAGAFKGGGKGAAIVLGDPNKSLLYTSTILSVDHDDLMPPRGKGGPLDKSQTDMLRAWILAGASWPEGVELKQTTRVDFVKDIQPIFEFNCLGCHREGNTKGGFRLDNKIDAMKGGENGVAIVPRRADKGLLIASVTAAPDDEKLMPPKKKDGPLPKEAQQLLASWVSQGAVWPDGVKLVPRKREDAKGDELAGVVAIHQKLVANLKE